MLYSGGGGVSAPPSVSLDTQKWLTALWLQANVWLARANGFDREWKAAGARSLARQRARTRIDAYFAALEDLVR